MDSVTIGDAQLVRGDCEDWLEALPECFSASALVTDPPYGIGFKYESHDDTPDGYGEWIWRIISSCEALLEPLSPVFVWQASANIKEFGTWFPRDWRIFVQAKNFVQIRDTPMQYAWEPVLAWWTPGEDGEKPWRAEKHEAVNRDWFVANSAAAVSNVNAPQKGHPCPRQLDVVSNIVNQWCRPGRTVVDPFMGSGTTGVACANLGRKFIGVEKEPKYFDIACERIEAAYAQGRLFA